MQDVAGELRSMVGVHPLKNEFKQSGVTYIMIARYCATSPASIAHYLNNYRPAPVHIETKMQALAARVRREREAMAQVVAGDE